MSREVKGIKLNAAPDVEPAKMAAYRSAEKLKCEKCRREVIVTRPGEGQLICCGKAMKTPLEGLTVDREFVQKWSKRYAEEYNGGEELTGEKADLDWIFKEKDSARASLQKAGLWKGDIGDSSDEAWLEHVRILRELSVKLNVTRRELGRALFAYEKFGNSDKLCPYCNGTGKVDGLTGGDVIVNCPVCRGMGYNFITEGSQLCAECCGKGKFIYGSGIAYTKMLCGTCEGTGWVLDKRFIEGGLLIDRTG